MIDIIHILPDAVANQIAAGEVVQRPASVVKELLENAVDAGASQIDLIIKDAGKTLIQVNDNGCGMSETDARCCFERHATSKIRDANDLFAIKTMGFRGEALASIAAVAQVELKSQRQTDALGTHIRIEGSVFKEQQPCACKGTTMLVKNLFFNVPARRKFLKSDTVENNHIQEEFLRVALVHHNLSFSLYSNDKLLYKVEKGSFKRRIIDLFGNNFNEKLLPVQQAVELLDIQGFVGKPEHAKKSRGEQYFFVNGRFMKSPYLSNAVERAYENLIAERCYPSYFLCLTVDPKDIDVNIHPTKTEIKFADERMVYGILRAAVKKSLGQFELAPQISFDEDITKNILPLPKGTFVQTPQVSIQPDFNPFDKKWKTESHTTTHSNLKNWDKLYDSFEREMPSEPSSIPAATIQQTVVKVASKLWSNADGESENRPQEIIQILQKYIIAPIRSGIVIIDQQRAHERILYEQFLSKTDTKVSVQHLLFPMQCSFTVTETEILQQLLPYLHKAGFEIDFFGNTTFVIRGLPEYQTEEETERTLSEIAALFSGNFPDAGNTREHKIALNMAKRTGIKYGETLSSERMQHLVGSLFACSQPEMSPEGKKIIETLSETKLHQIFG